MIRGHKVLVKNRKEAIDALIEMIIIEANILINNIQKGRKIRCFALNNGLFKLESIDSGNHEISVSVSGKLYVKACTVYLENSSKKREVPLDIYGEK